MNKWLLFMFLFVLLVVVLIADILIGTVNISIKDLFNIILLGDNTNINLNLILFDFRLPKALAAIIAGAALSVSGLQMQTVFRNPLAGPYVLGISSGASLGVALVVLSMSSVLGTAALGFSGNWLVVIAAWLGSAAVLLMIFIVSSRVRDIMTILILGIMFGSVIGAVVNILQYFSSESSLKSFVIWTMGSLSGITSSQLSVLIPSAIIGLILSFLSSKQLDVLLLGENYAKTLGVNIFRARFLIFVSTSILAGSVTAFCGPIGFIGIAVPHIAKILFKTSVHKYLIVGSALIGAVLMLVSDIISQLPQSGGSIPINSITALLGIPIIIWIILRNHKISSIS